MRAGSIAARQKKRRRSAHRAKSSKRDDCSDMAAQSATPPGNVWLWRTISNQVGMVQNVSGNTSKHSKPAAAHCPVRQPDACVAAGLRRALIALRSDGSDGRPGRPSRLARSPAPSQRADEDLEIAAGAGGPLMIFLPIAKPGPRSGGRRPGNDRLRYHETGIA